MNTEWLIYKILEYSSSNWEWGGRLTERKDAEGKSKLEASKGLNLRD